MEKIKPKEKIIFCEWCSYKIILDNDKTLENFVQIKTSPIPQGIPNIDKKSGKIIKKSPKEQNKKIKCPKCGRGIVVKEIKGAYHNTLEKIKKEKEKEKEELDRKKRIEDGKFLEKKPDTDF